jgi:hypothetical protein
MGVAVDGAGDLLIADIYNHRVRKVTGVASPTVGQPALQIAGRICFQSDRDGNHEIYSMDGNGADVRRLTNTTAHDSAPRWSPDGSGVVFISDRDEPHFEIYTMGQDGTTVRRLTENMASESYPAWSPDGSKIAFESTRGGYTAIYTMAADGSGVAQLTNNPTGDGGSSWSPDGRRVAFYSNRDGNPEIYVMNTDGTGQTRLTDNPAADQFPSWSPDGERIIFESHRDGRAAPYSMRPDGTDQTRLTNGADQEYNTTWSPEGGRISYATILDGSYEVFIMDGDGSDRKDLTGNPANDGNPSWAPFRRIGSAEPGATVARTMTIENPGTAPLNVTGITVSDPRFAAIPSTFVVAAGGSRAVTVAFKPDSVGVCYAALTIASNDPELPLAKLIINGTGVAANRPPVLAAINPRTVVAGDTLVAHLSANDVDGDSLTYSVNGNPIGSALTGTVFTWVPSPAQVGVHTITFAVADGRGGTDTSLATITVRRASDLQTLTARLPGGATMDFIWIEPGTFTMGSPDSEAGWDADEKPQHQVTLTKGYFLARTELTQGQWMSVMQTTPWSGQASVQSSPSHPAVYV